MRMVKEYCEKKGPNHHVIFLVDEIGQYIADDTQLMLNLQTIVEDLGTACRGKAWVIVTSQEDIDSITKTKGNDFSKIQGRFDTRLSLSASNVDEVIRKRILEKNEIAESSLKLLYEQKESIIKNLITFTADTADKKLYTDKTDFADCYPFIPYQFNLLGQVLTAVRTHGASGKHLSDQSRSMLALFQESAIRLKDSQEGVLVPFSYSNVPQIKWVKSLETTGFRDFCFDKKTMTFGQINLFYGANGSGKTSVLEAIEYALTAEVRRVKDFKVKLPTDSYPKLNVYDTEAGIHTFTPGFSKKNNKEIERVWYGVPIGRTKSSLNENFNRFNAFDSEAAYKFIHESDNSEDSFASMFGNLMFGETVVDHEKKWQRFKRAFNERYTELRNELNEARSMVQYYEESLAQKTDSSRSEEIETGITALKFINRTRLPKGASDRYPEILEEMKLIRKYVEILSAHNLERMDFGTISEQVKVIKKNNLLYTRQRRDKTEEITRLTEENGSIKKNIFNEREKQIDIQKELNLVDTDIQNWTIVQNVLNHKETIKLVKDLIEELEQIERELYYISKIEQRPAIINFLKLDDYKELSEWEKQHFETELEEVRARRRQTENKYNEEKSAFGEREQQVIELRKIGKTLMTDARCPLCGHEYSTTQQLINIIDNAVVVDDKMDMLIREMQDLDKKIIELEKIIDRQNLIDKAKKELLELTNVSKSVLKILHLIIKSNRGFLIWKNVYLKKRIEIS